MANSYQEIYAVTRRIPAGRVSTYKRIANLAEHPGQARLVGYALHALRSDDPGGAVPWWRVINAAGRISNVYEADLQRTLLETEGVIFDERGYVDLSRFLWEE